MAGWAEARTEAMFKRVEGGFIFRWGGLAPHYYLVTEAQKAEIQRLMRTPVWRRRGLQIRQRIEQALEGARRTEQKITWRDRNETFARMLPMSGLFGTAVASALLFILFIFVVPWNAILGLLAVFVVYFFYLVILKLRLERPPKR